MLEITIEHFLSHPEQMIQEMQRRGWSGHIKLPDGNSIVLQWQAAKAVNDPMYKQGAGKDG